MQSVRIILDVDADPPLKGQDPSKNISIKEDIIFTRSPKGMKSGASSVGIVAPLPSGQFVIIEFSMEIFRGVAAAFEGAEQRDKETDGRN